MVFFLAPLLGLLASPVALVLFTAILGFVLDWRFLGLVALLFLTGFNINNLIIVLALAALAYHLITRGIGDYSAYGEKRSLVMAIVGGLIGVVSFGIVSPGSFGLSIVDDVVGSSVVAQPLLTIIPITESILANLTEAHLVIIVFGIGLLFYSKYKKGSFKW